MYTTSDFGRRALGLILRGVVTVVATAVCGAILMRIAPGWHANELHLDPRLSNETIEVMRAERETKGRILPFIGIYLLELSRGQAGTSEVFQRPVADLISERFSTTAASVSMGILTGWVLAVLIAVVSTSRENVFTTVGAIALSGGLLSVPSAVLAILGLLADLPPGLVITAVVFPRVFPHAYGEFADALRRPHVLMARARGIRGVRLFWRHVLMVSIAPLIAVAGASVPLAFGAAVPVEVLTDSPGLGQLAWRAALGRDMPVLVTITVLLSGITVAAHLLSDLLLLSRGRLTR